MKRKKYNVWTPEMNEQLRALFPTHTRKAIAEIMGLSESTIRGRQRRLGLLKEDPIGFCSQHQKAIPNSGRFAAGQLPHNTAIEGNRAVRKRLDSCGKEYYFIRVQLGKWIELSRYVWSHFYGPVPDGKLVVFADGNSLNCHPDNLLLIDRKQHVRRNHNAKKAGQTIASGKAKDSFYASRLFMKDKPMREFALTQAPELIALKRTQLALNNALKA